MTTPTPDILYRQRRVVGHPKASFTFADGRKVAGIVENIEEGGYVLKDDEGRILLIPFHSAEMHIIDEHPDQNKESIGKANVPFEQRRRAAWKRAHRERMALQKRRKPYGR